MAAKIREVLGPEVSIVHEIVSKEMGADSAIATHMVIHLTCQPFLHALHPPLPPNLTFLSLSSCPHPLGARGRRLHH